MPVPHPPPGPTRVRLQPASEASVRAGHPWVFDRGLRRVSGPGRSGDVAALYDARNRLFALGLYDPDSPIRIRILHRGGPVVLDADWWRRRLRASLQRRAGFAGAHTDGWRLVHGENDGLPGLVVDRFANVLVAKLYTPAWIPWLPLLEELLRDECPGARSLVLRLSRAPAAAWQEAGLADGSIRWGEPLDGPVVFREHGMRLEADPLRGQKTGFFLDHRDNRRRVRDLARGADVLNLFSYTAAFSLAAAFGGARSVTDVEISRHALEGGARNFTLNTGESAVRACRRHAIQADVFRWLGDAPRRETWDGIVVDPPSLAPREKDRPAALRAYAYLAGAAGRLVRPGGWILCASCSAHVRPEEFRAALEAALPPGPRGWRIAEATETPPDHPATFPEARYLKAVLLRKHGPR